MQAFRSVIRCRRGITLTEVLTAVALLAILVAVAAPALTRQVDRTQASRLAKDLVAFGDAAVRYYQDVERWPASLSQLTVAPAAGAPALGSGTTVPAELAQQWRGPYVQQTISGGPVSSGFGAQISPTLSTTSDNGQSYLTLTVSNLREEDVARVDAILESGDGLSTGRVRFSTTTQSLTFFAAPTF